MATASSISSSSRDNQSSCAGSRDADSLPTSEPACASMAPRRLRRSPATTTTTAVPNLFVLAARRTASITRKATARFGTSRSGRAAARDRPGAHRRLRRRRSRRRSRPLHRRPRRTRRPRPARAVSASTSRRRRSSSFATTATAASPTRPPTRTWRRRAHAVAIVPTDYDNRRDIDLLVVGHGDRPRALQQPARRHVPRRGGGRRPAAGDAVSRRRPPAT